MLKKTLGSDELSNKVCIILGTRPEIIKFAPIIRVLEERKQECFVIHTGQHYSYNLDKVFFKDLELPEPKYKLDIGEEGKTHGEQTGQMLIEIEKILFKEKPAIVLVEGDTNTVLAGALAAQKLHILVGHVEAGLRSFDREMPEEHNRVLADQLSDLCFAPTEKSKQNLLREGILPERIHVTGNTIVDAVLQNLEIAKRKSKAMEKFDVKENNFMLITMHREENVDRKERLENILDAFEELSNKHNMPMIYPIHPRTVNKLNEFNLKERADKIENLVLREPIGYLDFLLLEANAKLILTDSGGIQEEACILKVPSVVIRTTSDRPETVEVGANVISGLTKERIVECAEKMITKERNWDNPLGDGKTGARIIDIINDVIL